MLDKWSVADRPDLVAAVICVQLLSVGLLLSGNRPKASRSSRSSVSGLQWKMYDDLVITC
jgi:hypothetical protein